MFLKKSFLLRVFISAIVVSAIFPLTTYGAGSSALSKPAVPKGQENHPSAKKSSPELSDLAVESSSVTTHTVKIGGIDITYEAEAATYVLKEEDGKAKARIFYTAYTKKEVLFQRRYNHPQKAVPSKAPKTPMSPCINRNKRGRSSSTDPDVESTPTQWPPQRAPSIPHSPAIVMSLGHRRFL